MTDTKTTESGTQTNGASGYALAFKIVRTWGGLPGATLTFNLRMYLSGELSKAREGTIGLTPDDRLKALTDFRTRVLADVLIEPPTGFPDFPEAVQGVSLRDRAYEFFSRRDENGYPIFTLLVEDVVNEFWRQATPSPILPASVS
jgi:hypothetical protein